MNIAVFGCGNMATALVTSMHTHDSTIEFHTYTPTYTRAKALADKVRGDAHKELTEVPGADFYLLACKPQQVAELARDLKGHLPSQAKLISILAGTKLSTLQSLFEQAKIVRIMPNTPVQVNSGVLLFHFARSFPATERKKLLKLFHGSGEVFDLKSEDLLDRLTGLSASGPAYIFELARILEKKAQKFGLKGEGARRLVAQTLLGSAQLLMDADVPFETLRDNVTSKKGVTHEALGVLKKYKMEEAFSHALDAAYKRCQELSK